MENRDNIKRFLDTTTEFDRSVIFGDGRSFKKELDTVWFPDSAKYLLKGVFYGESNS